MEQAEAMPAGEPLIDIDDLSVELKGRRETVPILAGVSFQIRRGEVLALMGESGAGKSISALAIMGILPPTGHIASGRMTFAGRDLLALTPAQRRKVRGTRMAMIHQDAPTALNPVYPVGWQIAEMFRVHRGASAAEASAAAVALMEKVGIPNAPLRALDYPHQLSGGMRQRVMIAIAIALKPDLLIADEPTTALDVTVQAQILRLILDLQRENAMGVLLVTHDFGVVAETADRVAVLYAGRIIETGPTAAVLDRAAHPYSRAGALRARDGGRLAGPAGHCRPRREPCRSRRGLCLRAALRACPRCLPRPPSTPQRDRAGPLGRLPFQRGDTVRCSLMPPCWRSTGSSAISPSAGASCGAPSARSARWTASRSASMPARASASSANPGAASPRW
jgi:ABC-type dipeptide/oligopeptide/nickel transport system ATPase component